MLQYWPLLISYPAYIALMGSVMLLFGVSKLDVRKWVLRQAGRQRFLDLVRAGMGSTEHQRTAKDDPASVEQESESS